MSLAQDLGRFVANVSFERLPSEAVDVARIGFIDCIATMIAGAGDPAPQLLRKALGPPRGEASLYFSGEHAPAPEAAWINGTAGHALDYDDVASLRGHPSTVLVPAVIAEGEALGASGRAMLAAYVAGYETWAELAWRDSGHHHRKGWHPTGIFGPIGAAARASLRHLDAQRTAHALALAASQSSGIMANFGTMTKPFHAGRSAHSGLMAARLAEVGFTASRDALEHPQGFLSAVSPAGEVDRDTPAQGLGSEWKIVRYRLGIKKYPACYCTHRALDAMLELLARHALKPEEIERITVSLSDTHSLILRNHRPQTGLEAKFSIEFATAAAVIARRVGLTEYTDGFVRRPDVQELMRRVFIETNQDYDAEVSGASVWDQVRIELTAGGTIESEKVSRAKGHADRPLSESELFEKFRSCLDAGRAKIAPDVLFERLKQLESLSARELTAI
jgi:2-methylcitrate dehydratase PrpD